MSVVHFKGRIIPETEGLTMHNIPTMLWKDSDWPASPFSVVIEKGTFTVSCEIEKGGPQDSMFKLYIRAETLLKMITDLAACSLGQPLLVVFDQFVDHDGETRPVSVHDEKAKSLCTAFSLGDKSFDTVFRLLVGNPLLSFALRDMASTIGQPLQHAVHFARGVETIRHLIAPGAPRKKAWPLFNTALNLSDGYSKYVTNASIALRHGDHVTTQAFDGAEVRHRGWVIMTRYLEYLKGGSKPLTAPEFPLL